MSRTAVALLLATVLSAAVGIVYVNIPDDVPVGTALRPDNAKLVSDGHQIYLVHCAECHGKNLEGQPNWRRRDAEGYLPAPPHDETGHTWHHADALLFRMTKDGLAEVAGGGYKTRMPAYADILSDEEIVAVLSYIKSRWPETIRERHDRLNQRAAR
ncbi:MAG: c-type cytochrome [Hyphomicrobiaceae bacterium]|nr:c-type cytochrome [Hyphomicrobiaceae bacterium]